MRERISINDDWRFRRGDPPADSGTLLYDVRPEVRDAQDDRAADARPEAPVHPGVSEQAALKPWILPTGNAFLSDSAQWYVPPQGNLGEDVAWVRSEFDDGAWQRVDLPHDWAIERPLARDGPVRRDGPASELGCGLVPQKAGHPASDAGRSIFLDVDGAMSYATVWLNNQIAGGWPYGYASWRVDLTPYVVPGGTNQLVIRLDNPPSSSRWYPGGGIYRNTWLTKTAPLHVAHWGTRITTPEVSASSATVDLEAT